MNISPINLPPDYESSRPTQGNAVAPGAPPQNLRDMRRELPSLELLSLEKANFADAIGNMFRETGVRIPPVAVLANDYAGNVRVTNDHPDTSKIEKLFADNPTLQQSFAKIASWASLQRAAENFKTFFSAYEGLNGQPDAQQALIETEIARNRAPFYMAVTPDGIETFFGNLLDVKA